MWFFRRLPPTHARVLWALVAASALCLAAGTWYAIRHAGLPSGTATRDETVAQPVRNQPSLVGRIEAVEGDLLRVDSKQGFEAVRIGPATRITTVGGASAGREILVVGAQVAATGRDLGDGRLDAEAIAVLAHP